MKTLFGLFLILPLASFIIITVIGRRLGVYGSMLLTCCHIFIALIIAIILFFQQSFASIIYSIAWKWIDLSSLSIFFNFRYDSLTAIMFIVVSLVSFCVHIYSCVYMYADPFLSRFLSYLSLFTFFMLVLVSSSNFLILFLGWEGVGLASYLLIGFWYTRAQAGKSASKAFLINKIGDLFFLSGISLIFIIFHTLDFSTVSVLAAFQSRDTLEIISIFLFMGAVGKSAQIGLHTWLPEAMEGPTPVSALIHAATMVTAGVFLLIRCSPILEYTPNILYLIAVWGGITALISGTIGIVQNDIKKIIAYSTCSQLGYMVLACGLSIYNISLFHLFNHAFFKALLFLTAGSIIHLMYNEQDIRKMGGLTKLSPFMYITILLASLALAGFPFLAGFYSKDFIIETASTKFWVESSMLYWLAITAAAFTVFYSVRLLEQVFWGPFMGFKNIIKQHSKITFIEISVLTVLALLSLFSGYIFKDIFVGFGSNYFNNSIHSLPTNWIAVEAEFIAVSLKILPLIATFIGIEIELNFFEYKWYFNEVTNGYFALPALVIGRHFFEQYEKLLLEVNGPLFFIDTIKTSINIGIKK